ncbi:hypothetical protein AB1Y20_000937 [Prymnesium parvum]|uniref:Uncharacterized protein n=1 Tax=Prymnesium parvum TaxID=97485 RepID=A0AB34KA05_PRYPA
MATARGFRAVGDWLIEAEVATRGYTTRAKEEQRRTAAPAFTGRVRKWQKRQSHVGHMKLVRWERVEEAASAHTDSSSAPNESPRGERKHDVSRAPSDASEAVLPVQKSVSRGEPADHFGAKRFKSEMGSQ